MRNLIRRILREENEKNPKDKLLKMVENLGLLRVLKLLSLEDICAILEMSTQELFEKYHPYKDKLINAGSKVKKLSLRRMKPGQSIDTIINVGVDSTAKDIIPWHDDEGVDFPLDEYDFMIKTAKTYLKKVFGDETADYIKKVVSDENFNDDGYNYVFRKHSERYGGTGFSDGYKTWGDLILNHAFPINWWEVKDYLDNKGETTKLILEPGDEHNNYGYYFSISKIRK